MIKNKFIIFCSYILALTLLANCGSLPKPEPPRDPHQVIYPGRFIAPLPSSQWQKMTNNKELNLFAPELTHIYYKKTTGSVFLVRSGRRPEFGVPPDYDLTTGQLIFLIKQLPKGDFLEKKEFESSNPLLEKAKKIFKFTVKHPTLGPGQIIATTVSRGEILLIEMFIPQAALETDEQEFYLLLDSLQERKKE